MLDKYARIHRITFQIMKKQLSIFLAVVFLTMQMASFTHMAELGFEHHEHDGHPCQIDAYFHASHSFDSAVPEVAVAHSPVIETIRFSFVDSSQRLLEISNFKFARAPPHFS